MNKETKGYIAGFLDADGCISLCKNKVKSRNNIRYSLFIIIVNTDKRILEYIKGKLKVGKIYQAKPQRSNHKTPYHYRIQDNKDIEKVLKQLVDYLILKKAQAMLALKFLESRKSATKKVGRGSAGKTSFTGEEVFIYEKMKELNKKGVSPNN
ncbi:MAG: LAGLIDADG family homing endonuclease [Rickettsiaceae bacterium]|nr:LAGLIDADG family homing endonuclease [Rickettsiaceae bacterium]